LQKDLRAEVSEEQILVRPLLSGATLRIRDGVTPLVQSRCEELRGTWLKLEGCNPTGSFKDRIMRVLVDEANSSGAKFAIVASSGNAAVSACANAARVGIRLVAVVPTATPRETVAFISRYPILLLRYGENPSDSHALAKRVSLTLGIPNLSSTFSESGAEFGCRTIGHEIAAQLPNQEIRALASAVSVGPVLIGARNGLLESERESPTLIAGQAKGCSPIARAFEQGAESVEAWSEAVQTEALSIADTLKSYQHEGDYFLRELRRSKGYVAAADDFELARIKNMLREVDGVETELSCCAAIYALLKSGFEGETTVVILTGSGTRQTVRESVSSTVLPHVGFYEKSDNRNEKEVVREILAWIN
jgi:threonine synthase